MHGGGKTLTLMTAAGNQDLLIQLRDCADAHLVYYQGSLPLLIEKQLGGLQQIINRLSVQLLNKNDWDRKKTVLGDRIYD